MAGQPDWVELLFSSAGRLARGPFLLASIALIVVATIYGSLPGPVVILTGWIFYPALLFTGACILSKRLHDRGHTGWLAAVVLVAMIVVWPAPHDFFDFLFGLVIVWAVVELGALPGEQGSNRYGPNPLKSPA